MPIDYTGFAIPKPAPRERKTPKAIRVKAKPAEERDRVAQIRDYVRARERNRCRCCRSRVGQSMHELKARSLRGRVSKTNSVWVCGDGVAGCHGMLQRKEILADYSVLGAEGVIVFTPQTFKAAEWVKVAKGEAIESAPMRELEQD